jgi:hypothetical protein
MTSDDSHRVLIVGCGQLGSRHLQAVAALPQVSEIEVVDPRPDALQLGRDRLAEVPDRKSSTVFRWLSSLEQATREGGLCIIATQAQGRCQLVRSVVEKLGYSSFLLEKIVAQSVREMEELIQFSEESELSVWVNFKTRAYRFHQKAKQHLDPSESIVFNSVGGNFGLANAIHDVDLFAYYDEASWIKSSGSKIDPILHPSKRGKSLFDLSGSIYGHSEKGSHFTLSLTQEYGDWGHLSISTPRYRCVVDHLQRCAFESDAKSGWAWRPATFDGPILVSEMTRDFAADILDSGTCKLPTLAESLVAHRFILSELQPHFSRLLGCTVDQCPVT